MIINNITMIMMACYNNNDDNNTYYYNYCSNNIVPITTIITNLELPKAGPARGCFVCASHRTGRV